MIKQVTTHLFRSPRPTSTKELKDAQIGVVISLESGTYELLHDDEYEIDKIQEKEIEFIEIDCSTKLPPKKSDVLLALDLIEQYTSQGINVLLHCKAGKDRTGFVVAVYRMKVCGWSFEQAYEEWLKEGRHWYYWWWKPALRKYSNEN